jgi:RHS repeat-associated protein
MRIRLLLLSAFALLVLAFAASTHAQVITGAPSFGSFSGTPDLVDNANLNVHYTIPVRQKAGRGTNFNYNLAYDSSIWQPVPTGLPTAWQPAPTWGWSAGTAAGAQQYILYNENFLGTTLCNHTEDYKEWTFTSFVYYDVVGTPHYFNTTATYVVIVGGQWTQGCPAAGASYPAGQTASADGFTMTYSVSSTGASLTSLVYANGSKYVVPIGIVPPGSSGNMSITDRNGNVISSNNGVYTDTLGTTALTVTNGTSTTLAYTAPSGATANYTISYVAKTVRTNFGCSGISEFGPTSELLVDEVTLPDSSYYQFTYEATPGYSGDVTGRVASVRLPTGGTISYTYTGGNNGIECADGSTSGLQRITPDTGSNYWSYSRALGSGAASTTTIKDPQGNQTTINFQGIYETERQVYQGTSTLLKTTYTCYNGHAVPCNSTSVAGPPFTQRSVTVQWPATSGSLESEIVTSYNTSGLVTEVDEYPYGTPTPGALARKTLTTYASLGNGIVDMPGTVTVEDGSSNVKAQTTYCYDEGTPNGTTTCAATGSPTATTGTPQHNSVSGSRGNLTTVAQLVQGSTTLGKTLTYYDTGNVLTATDVNAAQTTYSYGTGSCGNSFVTSISEPLSLSRSMTWDTNCLGGVKTSVTDENSKIVSYTYTTDPYFWRPNSATDQASNQTSFTYTGETSIKSSLPISGTTSGVNTLVTVDGLGRTSVSQLEETPTSVTYDSVETDYDSMGRPDRATLPYAANAGATNSSAPSNQTTYDALSRKTQVADTETPSRTVAFSYTQNDKYRTLGPAPTGENTKKRQYEYDALGRLTSVCEVTSLTGSGTCGQTNTATGYWTKYTYDLLNDLTGVSQNAQGTAQTRSYAYDDLRRMTSETNPESGSTATTYTYDTDSTCGTSKGDLVKKTDQVGNTICYAYDALHRLKSATYPSGSYASVTPSRYLVYDSATVNSVVMANVKARLAEAYTCTGSCTSKITDLGFSYTVRGQASDVYESTPHSSAYYHVTASYWANGAPNVLSNLTGLPTITYGVDGEGRVYSASASSGQNPLSTTSYNPASEPTAVNFGSSDSDSFTYDTNSDRMTKYTFSVNSQSVVGTLTWNSIGTLETLAITDAFNSTNAQTCSYTHDDLSRIASDNCGSGWSQTFTYDAFGNISKSGTQSFLPTYSASTNRMTSIGSNTPTYDANGSVMNDFLNTYAWDSNGRPVTVDTVGVTYDALGRMVEQNKSGTYSEIVYGPFGTKLAIMQGTTLQQAFVSLTGGTAAVYNSSGLAYYRHSDWIGSSRFASTPTRTKYYDGAYGPFGEAYAQSGTTDLSFTGMNQDTASNVYDFPAREYGIQGRWPSPDPAGLLAADPADPTSWDRYAYVRNNPLSLVDPFGLSTQTTDGMIVGTTDGEVMWTDQGACLAWGGGQWNMCGVVDGSDPGNGGDPGTGGIGPGNGTGPGGNPGGSTGGSPGGGGSTPNNDVLIPPEKDIFHCPDGCVQIWQQLDCTLTGPVQDAVGSAADGAVFDSLKGAANATSDGTSVVEGVVDSLKEGTFTVLFAAYSYSKMMIQIGKNMVAGCKSN